MHFGRGLRGRDCRSQVLFKSEASGPDQLPGLSPPCFVCLVDLKGLCSF